MDLGFGAVSSGAISSKVAASTSINNTTNLIGVTAASQIGSTTISKSFTVSGVAAISHTGLTTEAISKSFTVSGVTAASHVGSFTEILSPNVHLVGITAVSAPGHYSIRADNIFGIAGVSANSGRGNFNVTYDNIQNISGVSATSHSAVFTIVTFLEHNLTGVAAVSSCGAVGERETISLIGVSAATATDHESPNIQVFLEGVGASSATAPFNLLGIPGNRVFFISGIKQLPIASGIVMLPTSEDVSVQELDGVGYAIASSQFYTIGEVYWNSFQRTEGVDYTFVSPFSHIIQFDPTGITTDITLVYYRWDIGVRSGFQVNSYPVPFSFSGTSIIAEAPPKQDVFFTVQYTLPRVGINPTTMFARFANIVDDIFADHALYDGSSGFATNRRVGYKVFDTLDNSVWGWNGVAWYLIGAFVNGDTFFVKQTAQTYKIIGGDPSLVYTAGDGPDIDIPEVLTYPPYGESIGKNFLDDAFSSNAAIDYPSAYAIAQRPGPCEDLPTYNSIPIKGLRAFSNVGVLQAKRGWSVIGQNANSNVGKILTRSENTFLSAAVTANTGHIVVAYGRAFDVSGVSTASAPGIIHPSISISYNVLAIAATGSFDVVKGFSLGGNLSLSASARFGPTASMTGVLANSSLGNITISEPRGLLGVKATTATGHLSVHSTLGQQVFSHVGLFKSSVIKQLSGISAGSSVGTFDVEPHGIKLLGEQTQSHAGTITTTVGF